MKKMSQARRRAEMYLKGRTWEFAGPLPTRYGRPYTGPQVPDPGSYVVAPEEVPQPASLQHPRITDMLGDAVAATDHEMIRREVEKIVRATLGGMPSEQPAAQKLAAGVTPTPEENRAYERALTRYRAQVRTLREQPQRLLGWIEAKGGRVADYRPEAIEAIQRDPSLVVRVAEELAGAEERAANDPKYKEEAKRLHAGPEYAPVPAQPEIQDVAYEAMSNYEKQIVEAQTKIMGGIAAELAALDAEAARLRATRGDMDRVAQINERVRELDAEYKRALITVRRHNPHDPMYKPTIEPGAIADHLEKIDAKRSAAAGHHRRGMGAASPLTAEELERLAADKPLPLHLSEAPRLVELLQRGPVTREQLAEAGFADDRHAVQVTHVARPGEPAIGVPGPHVLDAYLEAGLMVQAPDGTFVPGPAFGDFAQRSDARRRARGLIAQARGEELPKDVRDTQQADQEREARELLAKAKRRGPQRTAAEPEPLPPDAGDPDFATRQRAEMRRYSGAPVYGTGETVGGPPQQPYGMPAEPDRSPHRRHQLPDDPEGLPPG